MGCHACSCMLDGIGNRIFLRFMILSTTSTKGFLPSKARPWCMSIHAGAFCDRCLILRTCDSNCQSLWTVTCNRLLVWNVTTGSHYQQVQAQQVYTMCNAKLCGFPYWLSLTLYLVMHYRMWLWMSCTDVRDVLLSCKKYDHSSAFKGVLVTFRQASPQASMKVRSKETWAG